MDKVMRVTSSYVTMLKPQVDHNPHEFRARQRTTPRDLGSGTETTSDDAAATVSHHLSFMSIRDSPRTPRSSPPARRRHCPATR